jgi:hypothetical protein
MLCLVFCAGCCKTARKPYYGPTQSISAVVDHVNDNAGKLPSLRGEGKFDAWIREGNGTRYISGDLTLLYMRPRSMRFVGKEIFTGPVIEIVSNDDRYWVLAGPSGDRTMWHGRYANLDRVDTTAMPVRPDLVLEVLGIQSIQTNLLEPPVPVMRFNNEGDAYVLVWNAPLRDRWVAVKEIWYERATLLPRKVVLYDTSGRAELHAVLTDHQPVEIDGLPKQQWPQVATSYELLLPESGLRLKFHLKTSLKLSVQLKGITIPNARSFAFPDEPEASQIIDLDARGAP